MRNRKEILCNIRETLFKTPPDNWLFLSLLLFLFLWLPGKLRRASRVCEQTASGCGGGPTSQTVPDRAGPQPEEAVAPPKSRGDQFPAAAAAAPGHTEPQPIAGAVPGLLTAAGQCKHTGLRCVNIYSNHMLLI